MSAPGHSVNCTCDGCDLRKRKASIFQVLSIPDAAMRDMEPGKVKRVQMVELPYSPDRNCNPTGKLIGRKGTNANWIRKVTGCVVHVPTDQIRSCRSREVNPFYKPLVTVVAEDEPDIVDLKLELAVRLVEAAMISEDAVRDVLKEHGAFHPQFVGERYPDLTF